MFAGSTGSATLTSYKWKAKYGGLDVSEARRLKILTDENAKLKKLLADAMIDNTMLKDLNLKKTATRATKRQTAAHLCLGFRVSQRRAC
jgi:hypothetical protein